MFPPLNSTVQGAAQHTPLWRWRWAPHTVIAAQARRGEALNTWHYCDEPPRHPSINGPDGFHLDAEVESVTADILNDALTDAYEEGRSDERRGVERGGQHLRRGHPALRPGGMRAAGASVLRRAAMASRGAS